MPTGVYTRTEECNKAHMVSHKPMSEETKKKHSKSMKGKNVGPKSLAMVEKMSEIKKEWHKNNKHPMQGKHHKEETCKILSEKAMQQHLDGRYKKHFGKSFIREDLKEFGYIRCSNEANYLRYLIYFEIEFEYQIPILLSNNRWYICDVYLPRTKEFIELKGNEHQIDEHQKQKYELLKKDYPLMNWKILFQTSTEWKNINKFGRKNIPNWENY